MCSICIYFCVCLDKEYFKKDMSRHKKTVLWSTFWSIYGYYSLKTMQPTKKSIIRLNFG